MEINQEVLEILKEFKIERDSGLLCLLGIYYKLDVDTIVPEEIVKSINLTKIVDRDYSTKTIVWNIPLFEGEITEWDWVKLWNGRWKVNPDRKASNPDVLKRMKEFFRRYPHIRKEDVIKGTDIYFAGTTSQYLKNSAAFIFDGAGANKKSILLGYCERVATGESTSNQRGTVIT